METKTRIERAGYTVVSSVSISKEMKKLIDDYSINITEALRRGVAMVLAERGIHPYANPLNDKRLTDEKKIKLRLLMEKLELSINELKGGLI